MNEVSMTRIEKHFERAFKEIENDTKETNEFGRRVSKQIAIGKKRMSDRAKNRKLIRNKQLWDE